MSPAVARLARTAELMGTVFSAHVIGTPSDPPQVESAIASCFAHLSELEAVFSPFRTSSDIHRLRTGAARLEDLDPRVSAVADACRAVEAATAGRFSAWRDGWFDPTGYVKGWAADVAAQRWLVPLLTMPGVTAVGLNAGGDVRV
ncbi:MAG: FAD:protein FMN transferase, partial [Microbacterium sp.]